MAGRPDRSGTAATAVDNGGPTLTAGCKHVRLATVDIHHHSHETFEKSVSGLGVATLLSGGRVLSKAPLLPHPLL